MDKKIVIIVGVTGFAFTLQEIILASFALTVGVYILAGLMVMYALFLGVKAFNLRITTYKARCDREAREHARQAEYSVLTVDGQSFIVNDSGLLVNASLVSDSYFSMAGPNSDDPKSADKWAFFRKLTSGRNSPRFQDPETLNLPNPEPGPVVLEGPGPGPGPEVSTVNKILSRTQSCRLVGSTGLGKSNLSSQIIEGFYRKYGRVYVLNVHADSGTYPDYVQVVGMNRNNEEARAFLQKLCFISNERYEGPKPNRPEFHQPVPVVIEEVELFHKTVSDIWFDFMESLCVDFRKISIRCVLIAQSDSVDSWGVPGRKSMLGGLDLVELFVDNGDFFNLYTEAGGNQKSRTKTALAEIPGYEDYDISAFDFDDDLMPDTVELDLEAGPGIDPGPSSKTEPGRKIIDYIISRGGAVVRGKLTTSKCLGKNSRTDNYDLILDTLLESGQVHLQAIGKKTEWVYSVRT